MPELGWKEISMRILDVRRHTMREKPGAHLSEDGIKLAEFIGNISDSYDLVVTSTIPRAIETAIAMGYEVHQTIDALGHLPGVVFTEIAWPKPFSHVGETMTKGSCSETFAQEQAKLWQRVAERLPNSQRGLIVTHGGFVELGAIASDPGADYAAWGGAIGYCEGVRLIYDENSVKVEILRVPDAYRMMSN